MVDWIAYLNALTLSGDVNGLKLKASEIATLNKQFGANPDFALCYDKDHGLVSANIMLLFPMLILMGRQQQAALDSATKRMGLLEQLLQLQIMEIATLKNGQAEAAKTAGDETADVKSRLSALETAMVGLNAEFSTALEHNRGKHSDFDRFAGMFSSVFALEEPYELVSNKAGDTETEPLQTPPASHVAVTEIAPLNAAEVAAALTAIPQ
jgi:hypothetical protein